MPSATLTRSCQEQGCITRLASSNPGPRCYSHRFGPQTGIDRLYEVMRTGDWELRAACYRKRWPTRAFFADQGSRRSAGLDLTIRSLKSVCFTCPVRTECLTESLVFERSPDGYITRGIWGGMTDAERHRRGVIHLPGCRLSKTKDRCRGCRPIPDVIAILADLLASQIARYGLVPRKEDAA